MGIEQHLLADELKVLQIAERSERKVIRVIDTICDAVQCVGGPARKAPFDLGLEQWPCAAEGPELVITVDFRGTGRRYGITLKDGAVDHLYGMGTNPDSGRRGPPDIPRC